MRVACLEESLAFVLLAFMNGKAIDWCIGVKLAPFSSHAWVWVEVNGVPFQESEELNRYQRILVV